MIDRRIRIPRGHASLIDVLCGDQDKELNGPFKTKASVLGFAAALGASEGDPIPFSETEGDPIRKSVFDRAGYESLINILAVSFTRDPNVLSDSHEMEEQRAQIFEGYANRGLNMLKNILTGENDCMNRIRLLILNKRKNRCPSPEVINITSLIQ